MTLHALGCAPAAETLAYLKHQAGVWLEITNLLIPGASDSDTEISALTRWVVGHLGPDVPVHFTAFHPDFKMLDRPPTPPQTLARARRIALDNGIRYAYTGNVHDTSGQSTYCHGCGELVIERDWYRLGAYRLTGAALAVTRACPVCSTAPPETGDNGGSPCGSPGRRRADLTRLALNAGLV